MEKGNSKYRLRLYSDDRSDSNYNEKTTTTIRAVEEYAYERGVDVLLEDDEEEELLEVEEDEEDVLLEVEEDEEDMLLEVEEDEEDVLLEVLPQIFTPVQFPFEHVVF